jgi:hypothetical protein
MPVLKGVKRHTWYNNQRLLLNAQQAIAALAAAGVDPMTLKGGAMTLRYYRDFSLRPMEDVDLMVRHEDAARAIEALRGAGFTPADQWLADRGFSTVVRRYVHAAHFKHRDGLALDLHWNLTPYGLGPEADVDLWEAAGTIDFHGHAVRTLSPADQLLHICVHGATWDNLPPIRWIPDAVAVINHGPGLDWDRLLDQARRRRVTLMTTGALSYLHDNIDGIVPAPVLSRFHSQKGSVLERMEYKLVILGAADNPVHTTAAVLFRYLRASRHLSLADRLRMLPGFLSLIFAVDRTRDLPKEVTRRALASWTRFLFRTRRSGTPGDGKSPTSQPERG